MVSDVYEFDIPEVRLFYRFCQRKDNDYLPIGKKQRKACARFSCSFICMSYLSCAAATIWINSCSTRSLINCLIVWLVFKRRIAFACSNHRYLAFSSSLLFLFAAWEGPHHPRNLLLGVVYTAKVSLYQTHLMCCLRVWIIPTQIQIHAPALNYTQNRLSRNRAVVAWIFSPFCRM